MGAVRERIPVTPVSGAEHVRDAFWTCCRVGRNRDASLSRLWALADLETPVPCRGDSGDVDRGDPSKRRRFSADRVLETLQLACLSFDLEDDSPIVVQNEAGEPTLSSDPVKKGPESDPLHDSLDP
jgi:hypothetical protein